MPKISFMLFVFFVLSGLLLCATPLIIAWFRHCITLFLGFIDFDYLWATSCSSSNNIVKRRTDLQDLQIFEVCIFTFVLSAIFIIIFLYLL